MREFRFQIPDCRNQSPECQGSDSGFHRDDKVENPHPEFWNVKYRVQNGRVQNLHSIYIYFQIVDVDVTFAPWKYNSKARLMILESALWENT